MNTHFSYNSVQTHVKMVEGKRMETTEATSIRNGKGFKTVKKRIGSRTRTARKRLSPSEIRNIRNKKFMPRLFQDCHGACILPAPMRSKTKKVKKGSK